MQLPPYLLVAIEEQLHGAKRARIAAAAAALSERYRGVAPLSRSQRFVESDEDVLAYLSVRMPATFAAALAVFTEVRAVRPDLRPTSLLDLGAGPGTATLAAAEVWPELDRFVLVERDERFIRYGQAIASQSPHRSLAGATWLRRALTDDASAWAPEADLVVASYVTTELSEPASERVVAAAWAATDGALVLVEPGTSKAFERLRAERARLISAGAHLIAPCPHADTCPMAGGDWCHFAQRLPRSRLHREAKQVDAPFEDEPFSYVAVGRSASDLPPARVLRRPGVSKALVELDLCTPAGRQQRVVPRRDRASYAEARRLRWGSALPTSLSDPALDRTRP